MFIAELLEEIKEILVSQQADLDAAVQSINDSLTAIEAEVAQLVAAQQANKPLDFTNLQTLVARAQADVPPTQPPPPPPPPPTGGSTGTGAGNPPTA